MSPSSESPHHPTTTSNVFPEPEFVEPTNAFQWPLRKKWIVTLISILATFTTMLNGTIITVAHVPVAEQFHLDDSKFPESYWLVTSWTLGGAISSLSVLPLLEDFGLRSGFLGTYLTFILIMIPQALAPNLAVMLVFRFLTGGCVSILANTAASVIGNVWESERARTIPMSVYITCYLMGISIGPVIGASILQFMSWRWLLYMQIIWHSIFFPIYYYLFYESRALIISKKIVNDQTDEASSGKKEAIRTIFQMMSQSVRRPLYMLFTEPVLFAFTLWSAFAIGIVYLFTQSVEQVYAELYDWSPIQAGYVQAAVVIGTLLGWSGTMLSSYFYFASIRRNKETPGSAIPEARLYVSVFGSIFGIAAGMFMYGWTAYANIPWIVSALGLAMVGFGTVIVVTAAADYIVDSYASYAGSAVAAVVLGENIVAAFLPLASQKMYTDLGFQWASSALGFATLGLSLAPIVLIIWGPNIRARSPFMRESLAAAKLLTGDQSQNSLTV